jgi:hypothetical protein
MFHALMRAFVPIWSNFGNCPFCMRRAFQAALAAWGVAAIIAVFTDVPLLLTTIAVGAIGLSLLWLTHILAFARKISFAFKRPAHSQYEAMSAFARALGVAATLSTVPRLSSANKIYEHFGLNR